LINPDLISLLITTATEEGGRFNWKYVAEYTVNFIILLSVLTYYLKEPVRNFLIERRGIIGNAIDEAEKVIREAKKRYEEYAMKMNNIEQEISTLREILKKEGEIERNEILRHAELASQKIIEEARETIRLETAKARVEIQSEAVSLAIGLAQGILKHNLKESDEGRFIDDFVKKVDQEKWHQSHH
jgi:F-type H+-transporting ATPase subunit b